MWNRLRNIFIRSTALFSKFLLIIFIAKFLSPSDVGLYGLIAANTYCFLFALGFEFYAYSSRELMAFDKAQWLAMLRDQFIFYIFSYIVILPFSAIIFLYDFLPTQLAIWFYVIVVLEHFAQEINRILILLSKQCIASWILLLRNSGFIISLLLMSLAPSLRTLSTIFMCWILGIFLACLCGLKVLFTLDHSSLKNKINWLWIRKGIKISCPLLIASLSIRCIFLFDRYFIDTIAGKEELGVYVIFMGVGNAILNFLDAGVISFYYPQIIAAAKHNNLIFRKTLNQLFYNVSFFTIFLIILSVIMSFILVKWLNQDIYTKNIDILYPILLSVFFHALSLIPQIGLYALENDKPNIFINIFGLVIFIVFVIILVPIYGYRSVPYSMCIAFLFILLFKTIIYFSTCINKERVKITPVNKVECLTEL